VNLLERSGAETQLIFSNWDAELQMGQIEDITAARSADFYITFPAHEHMLVPAVEKAFEAGIPAYAYCTYVASENVPFCGFDFDGPYGECCAGEWYRDLAERTGEELYIFEVWGAMGMETCKERHEGFHMGIDNHPLITVLESEDTGFQTERIMEAVTNAFLAHPELNAVWEHGGSGGAPIEGLKAAGRLLPPDDPMHVYAMVHDCDSLSMEIFEDGLCEGMEDIEPWRQADLVVKVAFLNGILGQPVPLNVNCPLSILDETNMYTKKLWGAANYIYCRMPDDYNLWPVLDTTENIFEGINYTEIPGGIPTRPRK